MLNANPKTPEAELELMKLKGRLKDVIVQHPGPGRAISMVDLYRRVFGKEPKTKINGTRQLRDLITLVQREGFPIGTSQSSSGGGYYLLVAGSDLEGFIRKEKTKALKILAKIAAIKRTNLPLLLNEIQLSLTADIPGES
ncbi:hypothetical protein SAMN05660653_00157 [Desulfonatronum thiosulfatophilum]|uniref:Uncharacterized protein n=1 Tax=Desulfonatronum thiosulfatophilum TaxID=617002 RepID=A0A1G6A503_9BACT|nr:hypothetical protein [Desulfonatronum thiosulfatophilum]SDB03512.1 hypothetical protein SAMN05660653_00157 [Desulfonatronum thiosulfatophilum]